MGKSYEQTHFIKEDKRMTQKHKKKLNISSQ